MSHAVVARHFSASAETAAEWYFRHAGSTYGPYHCGALRDIILAARIHSGLELRRATEQEWQTVPFVEDLVKRIDSGCPPIAEKARFGPSAEVRCRTSPISPGVERSAPAARRPASRLPIGRRSKSCFFHVARKESLALAAMLVVWLTVNAVVVGSFLQSDSSEHKYSQVMLSIRDEFRECRRSSASDSQWAVLQARADEKLGPIVRDLEKTADAKSPVRQHLLWAGRDHLTKMLTNAKHKPTDSERLFERHMEEARRLMAAQR